MILQGQLHMLTALSSSYLQFQKTQISSGPNASNQKPDNIQISNLGFNKNMSVYVNLRIPKLGIINPFESNIYYIIQNNTLHTSQKTKCRHNKEQSNNVVQEKTVYCKNHTKQSV